LPIARSLCFALCALALASVACSTEIAGVAPDAGAALDDTLDDILDPTARLPGGCGGNFAACVGGGGGGACATQWCTGACVDEVARCVRGGGGAACASRCAGVGCAPQEVWTEVWTWECGFPYGWGGQNAATPGKARATCTQQCDGSLTGCSIWHQWNGRAICTWGVPLDVNQNPW
jgi:hypothetical protein